MSGENRKPHIFKGRAEQPAMTRLKLLDPEARAEIFSWAKSKMNQDVCRARIEEVYGIPVPSNGILTRFCQWQLRQAVWDQLSDSVEQDESAIQEVLPSISRERMREITIKRQYAVANATGDSKLALNVVKADLKDSQDQRDWMKVRRETTKLFVEWHQDQRMKAILESDASNDQKTEQAGQLIFGDVWQ